MSIKSVDVKTLNRLIYEMRRRGLWAERHSYSIRIMHNGLIVASLHIYPGFNEAVLRLYGDPETDKYVESVVTSVLTTLLRGYKITVVKIR
jgi:hypothetical protein